MKQRVITALLLTPAAIALILYASSAWIGMVIGALCVLASWEWTRDKLLAVQVRGAPVLAHRYLRVAYASTLVLVSLVITVLLNQAAPDIVYKAF